LPLDFDFVDAPFRSAPAPGIDAIFKSGHFTWWPQATAQAIQAAHLWLDDYLGEHGPYDAVCGFSQGCSLIGSYLLYHAAERPPGTPPPFKAAIFICGGLPFAALEDLGLPVSQRAKDINDATGAELKRKAGSLKTLAANRDLIQRGVGLWDDVTENVHDPNVMPDPSDVFGLDFTKFPQDVRITIPTVHVYGSKDPRWPSSMQLAYFCDNRVMYDHGGGHDIPRGSVVSTRIAELVTNLIKDVSA